MVHVLLRLALRGGLLFLLAALTSCHGAGMHEAEGNVRATASVATSTRVVVYAGVGNTLRVYGLDTKTGELESRQTVGELAGVVQYVAVHPNRRSLYVSCSEAPPPKDRPPTSNIYAFAIDSKSGMLARLGEPYAPPLSRAINITVDHTGRYLLLAHNTSESASVAAIKADGSLGDAVKQPEERQHLGFLVHQIRIDPSNKWVMVPVRGDDENVKTDGNAKKVEPEKPGHLVIFEFNEGVLTKRSAIDYPSLLGPRHLDFHPSKPLFYVSMERGNRLITYKHENGSVTELFRTTTLADASLKFPDQRAGPIHVHPTGKWVYVANRNTKPCPPGAACDKAAGENDIAVFSLDATTGEPKLVQNADTHGYEARTMTIDPSLHFLVVANQKEFSRPDPHEAERTVKVEPNLSVFRLGDDGRLTYVRTYDLTGGEAWWVGAVELP
jgi:6-phosphogluconolactonase